MLKDLLDVWGFNGSGQRVGGFAHDTLWTFDHQVSNSQLLFVDFFDGGVEKADPVEELSDFA